MPTVGCMQPTAKSAAWRFVEKSPETAPDGGAQTFALFESAAFRRRPSGRPDVGRDPAAAQGLAHVRLRRTE